MKIDSSEQRSEGWHRARRGIPTASQFHRLITPKKLEPVKGEVMRAYLYELIYEKIFDADKPRFINDAMTHGIMHEQDAVNAFSRSAGLQLEPIGFVTDDTGLYGCSPDRRVVGKNQIVEIKCPEPWTQIGYLLDGPGDKYEPQVQGQLLITGMECAHFYSWHPALPGKHVITYRNERAIRALINVLSQFCVLLERETERIRRMMSSQANDLVIHRWLTEQTAGGEE